jgi:hypothetical protein
MIAIMAHVSVSAFTSPKKLTDPSPHFSERNGTESFVYIQSSHLRNEAIRFGVARGTKKNIFGSNALQHDRLGVVKLGPTIVK